jgi:hypothetical protein
VVEESDVVVLVFERFDFTFDKRVEFIEGCGNVSGDVEIQGGGAPRRFEVFRTQRSV